MEIHTVLNSGVGTWAQKTEQNHLNSDTYASAYEVLHIKEGEYLFREGDAPKGLYYVQSGCVKIYVNRQQTRGRTTSPEYVTKLVSAGEYFGYKALIRGTSAYCNAKAAKPSVIWLYPKELILRSLEQSGPLLKQLLQQSVADLDMYETTNQFHYLASVQERIAYQLVVLADRFGVPLANGSVSLNLKLTRNELAQMASTINESLSRHLTEFKNENLIDLNGKEILIKDGEGLLNKSGPVAGHAG
ncbi:MAG: Crp/Fnr family transcriptional regulator [Pseudobdellovibrionaceae bacterium]